MNRRHRRFVLLVGLFGVIATAAACQNRYGVIGHLDSAVAEPGSLRMSGWAHLPDGVAASAVRFEVVAGGQVLSRSTDDSTSFELGSRPDVDAVHGGVNVGWTVRVDNWWLGVPPRVGNACIAAVPGWSPPDAGLSPDTWIACTDVPQARTSAAIDVVEVSEGTATVRGWWFEAHISRFPTHEWVRVYLDGEWVAPSEAPFTLGAVRPDVVEALRLEGRALRFELPVDSGRHEVCLAATDHHGSPIAMSDPRVRVLSCHTFTA